MEEDGEPADNSFLRTVRKAAYRVKEHSTRICDAATLEAVNGIGPALSRVRWATPELMARPIPSHPDRELPTEDVPGPEHIGTRVGHTRDACSMRRSSSLLFLSTASTHGKQTLPAATQVMSPCATLQC